MWMLITKKILKYYLSPKRNEPNKVIEKNFWKNKYVKRLPYQRGDILAHNWNYRIKNKTNNKYSLDNVMKSMVDSSSNSDAQNSTELIAKAVERYLGENINGEIVFYALQGNSIPVELGALGECVGIEEILVGNYELGFDKVKSLKDKVVNGVKPGSEAFEAGLRDGQILLNWSFWIEMPWKKVSLQVRDINEIKSIEYYPMDDKGQKVEIYKLDKTKFKDDPDACIAWFK